MNAASEYTKWLESKVIDEGTRARLVSMKDDKETIAGCFALPMQFGTAGLRSTMDVGISHMNVYTVAHTTKGLADLVLQSGGKERGVAVCYDSRINSELFARTAAQVLAASGVKVYLFDGIRPTPELSFAILHYHCMAGINITASHNPKEYNGYKAYWEDGAQLPPEHAQIVSDTVAKTDIFSVEQMPLEKAITSGLVVMLGKETDDAYLDAVQACSLSPELVKQYGADLHIVYSPLHGTGYRLVPEILKRQGIPNILTVEEQMIPDGRFPTVASPNPENTECFALAAKKVKDEGLDCNMIIASDPDADRIGIALRGKDGEFYALTGNQIGVLLIDYIIKARKEKGILPENACTIKSIVSSNLFDAVCDAAGVDHVSVLTGFKFIGEKIKQWEKSGEHTFIFGYEESHGYLSGSYARDKDAVAGSMLAVEMACYHASRGETVAEALQKIYETFGFYKEFTFSVAVKGLDPMAIMGERMAALRQNGFASIAGKQVIRVRDYKAGTVTDLQSGAVSGTGLPCSDVLYYELETGDAVIVRPSGTEPKIKVYLLAKAGSEAAVEKKLGEYAAFMKEKMA